MQDNTNEPNPVDQLMQSLVGKVYIDDRDSGATIPPGLDESKVVRQSELPPLTRIIHLDDMVTMDYNPERWNVHIDNEDKVTEVKRG